jgi:hypothetical protein
MHGAAGDADGSEAAWQAALATAGGEGEEARLHGARVAALAAAGRFEAALAALEAMLDRFAGLLPVDASVPLAGGSGGGEGGTRRAPDAVRSMQAARNELLAAAQAAGEAAAARRVAALATLRGLPPDRGTYHSLLRASLAHGDGLAAVREGLEEMRRLGLAPTRETLSLMLKACAGEGPGGAACSTAAVEPVAAAMRRCTAACCWARPRCCPPPPNRSPTHTSAHLPAPTRPPIHTQPPPYSPHPPPPMRPQRSVTPALPRPCWLSWRLRGWPPRACTTTPCCTSWRGRETCRWAAGACV